MGNLSTPKTVQKLQTALHAKAEAEADYRFYALYYKISREDILIHAFAHAERTAGVLMKIYIACALTHVPRGKIFEGHISFIHGLAEKLKGAGHEVMYALVNSDPQLALKPFGERAGLCYSWDRKMVAEASFPSTGLGIEMQLAENKGTPIILCFRDYVTNKVETISYENPDRTRHDLQVGDGFITLMALGVPSISKVVRYGDCEDGHAKIMAAVNLHVQS